MVDCSSFKSENRDYSKYGSTELPSFLGVNSDMDSSNSVTYSELLKLKEPRRSSKKIKVKFFQWKHGVSEPIQTEKNLQLILQHKCYNPK